MDIALVAEIALRPTQISPLITSFDVLRLTHVLGIALAQIYQSSCLLNSMTLTGLIRMLCNETTAYEDKASDRDPELVRQGGSQLT